MISGSYLENNGWKRKGSTYTKGEDVIIYDGCDWWLTKKIKYALEIHEGRIVEISGKLKANVL